MTGVLLVRLSAMGDLVQSLGAVASLHAVRPDWRVTFVTQREWAPLLQGVPGVARVVAFDRRGGLGAVWRVRRALAAERYRFALDLQGNWKSALLTWLSGARDRIGMAADWRQEPASRWLLRRTITCAATPHPARAAWELVRSIAPDAAFSLPHLRATAAELAAERSWLERAGLDPVRPFRVVIGVDPRDPRALRPERVARLCRESQAVLLLGPDERGLGFAAPRVLTHGPGEVRRLVALGNAVAAAGGEVVGPDCGATHVLLAAGARGRVLFGSQDPRRTAPPTATALVGA
ncbi:MAG TPA: hypothetical protein ENI87_12080, partial [bacterium]|nr:hypothetical protein [bacterium]